MELVDKPKKLAPKVKSRNLRFEVCGQLFEYIGDAIDFRNRLGKDRHSDPVTHTWTRIKQNKKD